MIPIPHDIIEKLNDGYFLIVKDEKNRNDSKKKDSSLALEH